MVAAGNASGGNDGISFGAGLEGRGGGVRGNLSDARLDCPRPYFLQLLLHSLMVYLAPAFFGHIDRWVVEVWVVRVKEGNWFS